MFFSGLPGGSSSEGQASCLMVLIAIGFTITVIGSLVAYLCWVVSQF